ncbi:ABC1 family protein [Spathaspora sp. JA1]|nr:ABC1 family protein [Spathaspora sp. JA1]
MIFRSFKPNILLRSKFTTKFISTRALPGYKPFRFSTHQVLGAVTGVASGSLILYYTQTRINNDVAPPIHELAVPGGSGETYESMLYKASQREETEQHDLFRQEMKSHSNVLKRIYYKVQFALTDYIIDPTITFIRFMELSLIFVPLLITSPICWFGKRNSGARLWYKLLRHAAELAGASFIKLGQWAASRTDIFSIEMCHELGQLHSNVKPHGLRATKRIICDSFDTSVSFDEIFDEFNEEPIGVGAIAQVYIGKLSQKTLKRITEEEKQEKIESKWHHKIFQKVISSQPHEPPTSNEWVAIKVLHPNVEVKINRDLKIMKFFAYLINIIPTMEWLSLPDEVEQFSILMKLQLDLRIEALNLTRFRTNFKDSLDIHFPKPFLQFTTRNVLVESFIVGVPMSKMLTIKDNFGKNLSKEVSDKGLDAFLKMLILDNFVHADLHPGNMMVRFYKNELFPSQKEYRIVKSSHESENDKIVHELLGLGNDTNAWCKRLAQLYHEGYHAEVCFLDVGLVTELNEIDRVNFLDLFKALSEFDGYHAGELMAERSRTPETVIDKEIFAFKVEKLVDRMKSRTFTLGNISIGDLLDQVIGMVRKHHVRMEGDFITIVVAILLLEGIGRQLDPQLDLFARFVYCLLLGFPTENDLGISLPVLRKLGVSKEGREILTNENALSMIKVWLALEVRQFINATIQDIHVLVKSDMLSPNV